MICIGSFPEFVLNFAPNFSKGFETLKKSLLDKLLSPLNLIFDLQNNTTDSQGVVTTAPANLSGYSVNAVIKDSSTSTTQLLFASTQNRMISIDFTNARATLTIPVKNTSRLPVGTKYYFINLVASDGNTQKIIQGIATVSDT